MNDISIQATDDAGIETIETVSTIVLPDGMSFDEFSDYVDALAAQAVEGNAAK